MKMIKPEEKRPLIHQVLSTKPKNLNSIEALTPETDKMVTGTFLNVECPGQPAKISCKYYKHQQYFCEVFKDGERRTIPLSVARHINERICYEEHGYLTDESGNPLKTGKKVFRYKFVAESF